MYKISAKRAIIITTWFKVIPGPRGAKKKKRKKKINICILYEYNNTLLEMKNMIRFPISYPS